MGGDPIQIVLLVLPINPIYSLSLLLIHYSLFLSISNHKHLASNKKRICFVCRIHGSPVADGWVGAVMQKTLAILKIFRTDLPTVRQGKVYSRMFATKNKQ